MENCNNDKLESDSDITNQTILFTTLSGYLTFSGNLAVEVTERKIEKLRGEKENGK